MIVWITGLSGAGKTTLCSALHGLLKPALPELVLLDGDSVRAAFGSDLTYVEADRVRQVRRLQGMARVLSEQNLCVLVAVLYNNPELLAWNRANLPHYFEVYLNASLETVMARDAKGIYAAAAAGREHNVVGVDIPWHPPKTPDLVIDGDNPLPPLQAAGKIIAAIPRFSAALARAQPVPGERLRP